MNTRQNLRKTTREKRLSLTGNEQKKASEQLTNILKLHPKVIAAQHIALYLANDGELNTTSFIKWCWAQNKHVYLPVIHPFSQGHLLFLKYTAHTTMHKNRFGIVEPTLNVNHIQCINNIDIMFTPLVAFDKTGARLGMGGGFYDRTLQGWFKQYKTNKNALPYPIGLAHDCQQVECIPTEYWDIPIPELITPTQYYAF